ncbi:MAG TPA: ABC transporter ATP-binding protein [Acidimicrobiales bacterium]|jgi:ATP-binding cassette, subfamily B, multidrug efflux pump|nr:ABC transporter ATP-binding protein [Acidimicrobiales bacterium]
MTTVENRPAGGPSDAGDDEPQHLPASETRVGPGSGRFSAAGMPTEKSKDFGNSVRRLIALLGPERKILVVVMLAGVGSAVLNVLGPRVLGMATDVIFDGLVGDGIDFDELHRVLMLAAALYVASSIFGLVSGWLITGAVQRLMKRLRTMVESKLNALPLSYIDTHARGDLLSRVTNDIDNIAQSLQQTLSQMLNSVLLLIGVMAMMFVISPLLALIALITVPASIYAMKIIGGRARPRFMNQWRHTGALNAQIEETFTGHAIVKSFGRQREVEERFRATNDQLHDAAFGAQFMSSLMQPATMFLGNVQYALVAVVGGIRVANGAISVGEVQAFIQYTRTFSMPLTQLASMMNVFQSGIASLERVLEVLDAEEQSPDPEASATDAPVRGRVAFEDVTFSYDPDKPLIESLSLVAEPGQTIAIVGPTGAGKTTLVNLIMRFYELDGGRITFDGRDITSMPRSELRSRIGMVLQDTWLFGGTIRDNIAYGNPDATDDDVLAAARAAYVDRFVHSLPDGYDTLINEEGDNISAGEKQLITIARAFLADRSILILDEATSSVDTRTEVLVQEAMNKLRQSRTSFVIAHRLSTIRGADTILVMENGRIVEQGSHDELLERKGAYHRLYNSQFLAPAVDVDTEAPAAPARPMMRPMGPPMRAG